MRKKQKKQILDLISSLQQAHGEIKTALQQKNNALARDVMCECQEVAVSIGESIEETEGEGHVAVSDLEEYCELLFKIYQETSGDSKNENKIYKNLRRQLIKVENSVKNDIAVRKEVAFFPYKASMWDSLESVYLAAKDDSDCDAYCVPIPYYDLKPDHSFGEMHYEGGQYPKNIEITDWQTYDFEEREPDEIYIHNGYDNWNLVTSVHPRFYSDNLKKHTEKLIYIPYFVLDEIEPDNQAAIEGMKHFCFMPGIINADKVIVQSEKMKQIYVNEYLKAAKANGLTGKHLDKEYLNQKKFLGLGSPKLDKVLNTKKEDLEIPEEWLKIIKKPDESWKKIIFYNTGIAALLAHNEKWVNKIEDVLKIFKENQNEVALLWRPHPLIENTMKSMRPGILQKYMIIKENYIREGWGIYDGTADVDRAVILSDAYYGDESSVVQLCKYAKKPHLIQNVAVMDIVGKNENYTGYDVIAAMSYMQDGEGWYVDWNIKSIVHFEKKNDEFIVNVIYEFDDNEKDFIRFVAGKAGEKLILMPWSTHGAPWLYDLRGNKIQKLDSVKTKDKKIASILPMGSVEVGSFVYFLYYDKLVKISSDEKQDMECVDIDVNFPDDGNVLSGIVGFNQGIVLVYETTQGIYYYNLQKKNIRKIDVDGKCFGIVFADENYLFLAGYDRYIYVLNKEWEIYKKLELPQEIGCWYLNNGILQMDYELDNSKPRDAVGMIGISKGQFAYIFPFRMNGVLVIDKISWSVRAIMVGMSTSEKPVLDQYANGVFEYMDDDYVRIYLPSNRSHIYINLETASVTEEKAVWNARNIDKLICEKVREISMVEGIGSISNNFDLVDFLHAI